MATTVEYSVSEHRCYREARVFALVTDEHGVTRPRQVCTVSSEYDGNYMETARRIAALLTEDDARERAADARDGPKGRT